MELFGLLFAAPVTLVASIVFCSLAFYASQRWPRLQEVAFVSGICILALLLIELLLSVTVGPFHLHQRFGSAYAVWHLVGFFLGPPAIGFLTLLAICRLVRLTAVLIGVATLLCWLACMATLLGNIMVDEDIHGIDGSGQRPTQSVFPP